MKKAVLLAVVVALAAAAGGVHLWREHERAESCEVIRADLERRGEVTVGAGSRRVVVMGDSYTQGWGLRDPDRSWPHAFARGAGATVRVDGFVGSGFTGSAYCDGEEFATRARRVARGQDELLVIQGGLNDVTADPAAVEEAAAEVVETSGAEAIVGPPPAPARDLEAVTATDAALADAAEEAGAAYVSTLDWDGLAYQPDRLHLTAESHAVFGARVAEELRAAGVLS